MITADQTTKIDTATKAKNIRQPMNVCLMIDQLSRAGTETQLLSLINNLNRDLVRPYLVFLNGEDAASKSLEPNDCQILRLGVRKLRSFHSIRNLFRLRRYLKDNKIDVLQLYFPDSTIFGSLAGWFSGVRHIVRTRRNTGYWMTKRDHWMGKFISRFIDATVANCGACKNAVVRNENATPDSVAVIPNGINLSRFEEIPPTIPNSPRILGVVANLRPVKDLSSLVQATKLVKDQFGPDFRIEVVGEGDSRTELENLIGELGLEDQIELKGSTSDIPSFLSTVEVAILCSKTEGMSNSIIEYMAAGRPTIATNVGGNPELIQHEETGLLVSPSNPEELAAAIIRLLDDPTAASNMGQKARQIAMENYSDESQARNYETFWSNLKNETVYS